MNTLDEMPTLWTLFSKTSEGFYANKLDGPEGGSIIVFEKKKVAEDFVAAMPDGDLYRVGKIRNDENGIIFMLEEALKNGIQNFSCCHEVIPGPDGGTLSLSHRPIRVILGRTADDGSHRHGKA